MKQLNINHLNFVREVCELTKRAHQPANMVATVPQEAVDEARCEKAAGSSHTHHLHPPPLDIRHRQTQTQTQTELVCALCVCS